MLNETQLTDLHAYSLKRQALLSERNHINYRLSLALKDFHTRWESTVIRAAIVNCNLLELDANFLAKYPVPEAAPVPAPEPVPAPVPVPVPNLEINLEPMPTLSYWESYPPDPAPPVPETLPATMPVSFKAETSRYKQTDTDWIVTPEQFAMYCKIYPSLMTVFNTKALKEIEKYKGCVPLRTSVLAFYKRFVRWTTGFDTTRYVKACLAHAFVIQYPQHAGMFDAVHVAGSGKGLYRKLKDVWQSEGMLVYK